MIITCTGAGGAVLLAVCAVVAAAPHITIAMAMSPIFVMVCPPYGIA
jgi:hypothetical protein